MTTNAIAPRRGTRAWSLLCDTWQTRVDLNGGWTCRRCGEPIPPRLRSAWQLGHPDDMTTNPDAVTLDELEPEHPRCNGSAGAAEGNRNRNKPPTPSREWLG